MPDSEAKLARTFARALTIRSSICWLATRKIQSSYHSSPENPQQPLRGVGYSWACQALPRKEKVASGGCRNNTTNRHDISNARRSLSEIRSHRLQSQQRDCEGIHRVVASSPSSFSARPWLGREEVLGCDWKRAVFNQAGEKNQPEYN